MYWLCLYFHAMPLETCFPGGTRAPCAVAEGNYVAAVNDVAAKAGIHPGSTLESALAISPALQIRPRDRSREESWLHERAARAFSFTSMVSVSGMALLLEIGGSERLFGGRRCLVERISQVLASGTACRHAGAPTALGALCLARGGFTGCTTSDFRQRFAALEIATLPLTRETLQRLGDLGIRQVGDCLRLPREGLRRRFPELPDLLDRAHGIRPDPQSLYIPAPRFEEQIDLPSAVWTWTGVQPAVDHLLRRLEAVLRRRTHAVDCLELELSHRHAASTSLKLQFTQPQMSARILSLLCQERLQAERLPEAVESVALRTTALRPMEGSSGQLFPGGLGRGRVDGDLLDHLQARLRGRIHGLTGTDDHRPERAFRSLAPGMKSRSETSFTLRPLWFLRPAQCLSAHHGQPCYQGRPLYLGAGPERIESGWWDGGDIARDYFIARDRSGARLWVFNDLHNGQWFLQGIFA
ncbi:MAG: Y-family DNA polymerase [Acidiferrobacteraceae bacterium]